MTGLKVGDRVRRGDRIGLITRISKRGTFLIVRVGTKASGTMVQWRTSEVTK